MEFQLQYDKVQFATSSKFSWLKRLPLSCSFPLEFRKKTLKKGKIGRNIRFGTLLNIYFGSLMIENFIFAVFVIVYNEETIDVNFSLYKLMFTGNFFQLFPWINLLLLQKSHFTRLQKLNLSLLRTLLPIPHDHI